MKHKKIGIYSFTNIVNSKIYIGSSNDLDRRWNDHLDDLRNGSHSNDYLQNEWFEYGECNFDIEWLIKCAEEELICWETFYINEYKTMDREFGYNLISPDRKIISEKTKNKMSLSHIGQTAWNKGHTILDEDQEKEVVKLLETHNTLKCIADRFGVSESLIHKIKKKRDKGKFKIGSKKLNISQAKEIRTKYNEGMSQRKLSYIFGVSQITISRVCRGIGYE